MPSGLLVQRLSARQGIVDVVSRKRLVDTLRPCGATLTVGGQLGFGHRDLGIKLGQHTAQRLLAAGELGLLTGAGFGSGAKTGEFTTGHMKANRREFNRHLLVLAGRLRLTLQRAQRAADLPQHITEADDIYLRGFQAPLSPFTPFAVLEDARRLLDDGASILRSRIQDGCQLALAHDDVLLAPDSRIGQKLLNIEEATRHAVQRVVALTRTKEGSGDRHLRKINGDSARVVVNRESDLGPAERRFFRRAGEDDVFHFVRADRPRALGPQHPCHGVDNVRLPRPVRPNNHREPGLELQVGCFSEGLKALQGERFEEHAAENPRTHQLVEGPGESSTRSVENPAGTVENKSRLRSTLAVRAVHGRSLSDDDPHQREATLGTGPTAFGVNPVGKRVRAPLTK